MENIVRYHEKILDHLIKRRIDNPDLFFVPRKINNKGRLDKGYWFIGNEDYLYLSLWNGTDWKEKIHNIGFVVLKNKTSYIELSAQDSDQKAVFLSQIAHEIGGFWQPKSKNKWFKNFKGTEYIEQLDFFIDKVKPIIDRLIKSQNPEGISLLDEAFHKKYASKIITSRKKQIEFGKANKIARICWNTNRWQRPSGPQGKSDYIDSHEKQYGYGHEEWLFDKSKIINEYQYGFLQPLNLTTDSHAGKSYNISLYTVNSFNVRLFVGTIKNVICISNVESEKAYRIYEDRGYIEQMKEDIRYVHGDLGGDILTNPEKLFNIKFKFDDVYRLSDMEEISFHDINLTSYRYKLLPQKRPFLNSTVTDLQEGNKKNTNSRKKVFNSECEYDPYHDMMQNALKDYLDDLNVYEIVQIEKDRVDIKALTKNGEWHYFEIKTDNAKLSIRKAIGQVMEYAYYPNIRKADQLIIVSDDKPSQDTQNYLQFIRQEFNIPICYKTFDLQLNRLSDEY